MFSKLILNPDIEWEQVVRKGIAQKIILFYEMDFGYFSVDQGHLKKTLLYNKNQNFSFKLSIFPKIFENFFFQTKFSR